MAPALKPQMRVGGLVRTRAGENVLHRLRRDCSQGGRVDGLPERFAESRLAAFPEGASDLPADQRVDQSLLDAAVPDPAVVTADNVIDAGERRSATKHEKEKANP